MGCGVTVEDLKSTSHAAPPSPRAPGGEVGGGGLHLFMPAALAARTAPLPCGSGCRELDGARPVHLIIKMIKWIRTSRLSIKNSLCMVQCPWFRGFTPSPCGFGSRI